MTIILKISKNLGYETYQNQQDRSVKVSQTWNASAKLVLLHSWLGQARMLSRAVKSARELHLFPSSPRAEIEVRETNDPISTYLYQIPVISLYIGRENLVLHLLTCLFF